MSNEPEKIRKLVGVCPQHDVLYDRLTVEEHIELYSIVKGVPAHDLAASVTRILEEVGLVDKRTAYSKELSGGMKRRLSVALAIVGDPRVVFLARVPSHTVADDDAVWTRHSCLLVYRASSSGR